MSLVTWSPSDKGSRVTLSNNNLTYTGIDAVRATKPIVTGEKVYYEIKINSGTNNYIVISNKLYNLAAGSSNEGTKQNQQGLYQANGSFFPVNTSSNLTISIGDTIGVAINRETEKITFYKNGVASTTFNITLTGDIYPTASTAVTSNNHSVTANFGNTKFDITLRYPSVWSDLLKQGYKPYDTQSKILIVSNNQAYTHNDTEWINIGNIPTIQSERDGFIKTYGMTVVTKEQLKQLSSVAPSGKIIVAKV